MMDDKFWDDVKAGRIKIWPICDECSRKRADYVSFGRPICARCVWRQRRSQERYERHCDKLIVDAYYAAAAALMPLPPKPS